MNQSDEKRSREGRPAHPSRSLSARTKGYGIAAGYEKVRVVKRSAEVGESLYAPLPHSGYYGSGIGSRPFPRGQARFAGELAWYHSQYGERTSGEVNVR